MEIGLQRERVGQADKLAVLGSHPVWGTQGLTQDGGQQGTEAEGQRCMMLGKGNSGTWGYSGES